MDYQLVAAAILVVVTILLWASARLPEYLTTLIFFAGAMIFAVAPASVVFSGFASSAFWLVVSGYVLGIAIVNTGLAARVARILVERLSARYAMTVFGVVALSYLLAFVMPSNMGRIAVLMPVVLALADRLGLGEGRPGRIGLALAVGFGTFQLSASILPANVPNLVMAGAMETAYGLQLAYLPYLLLNAPVLGILKGALLWLAIVTMFPDRIAAPDRAEPPQRLTPAEKRLSLLLGVTLALWMTDSLHGISPAWIGLAAACLCLMPRIGFVSGEAFGKEVNHRSAIHVAGILGLAAVVTQSGLGAHIGAALAAWAPLDADAGFAAAAVIVAIAVLMNFVVTANGLPALFTPLASTLADASGLPLTAVLMLQIIGFSTPLLPYQAAPIVVAVAMAKVPLRAAIRLSVALFAATMLVLLPLHYLWMRLLGWL